MEQISLYFEVVHQLGDLLSSKLTDCTAKDKQAVRLFASLLLCMLHLLNKQTSQEEIEEVSVRIIQCRDNLQKFVKKWVVKSGVIGGSVFGARITSHDKLPQDTQKELKVTFVDITFALINHVSAFHFSYGRTCLD